MVPARSVLRSQQDSRPWRRAIGLHGDGLKDLDRITVNPYAIFGA